MREENLRTCLFSLIKASFERREKAYAPYSAFKVGAALISRDGGIFSGANVENASYGATVCAERCAVFAAVNAGQKHLELMVLCCPSSPCGVCRQVINEFASDNFTLLVIDPEKAKSFLATNAAMGLQWPEQGFAEIFGAAREIIKDSEHFAAILKDFPFSAVYSMDRLLPDSFGPKDLN